MEYKQNDITAKGFLLYNKNIIAVPFKVYCPYYKVCYWGNVCGNILTPKIKRQIQNKQIIAKIYVKKPQCFLYYKDNEKIEYAKKYYKKIRKKQGRNRQLPHPIEGGACKSSS